jgi:asparagine synthase (glutamine-hydrolysing)
MMRELSSSEVKTFSIGFGAAEYDESEDASRIARHLGTSHTQFIVNPSDVMDLTSDLSQIYDEPFADSSALPTTLVSRLARRHVTVVLTGDGGDEVFAGYNRHIWGQRVWSAMSGIAPELRATVGSLLQRIAPERYTALFDFLNHYLPKHLRVRSMGDKLHKLGRVASASDPEHLHLELASHFREADGILSGGGGTPSLPALVLNERLGDLSALERALRFDTLLGLPADMLVKVDRATMSVGLEARQPLLDHRLVELAWRIPESLKFREGVGKWVLRKILEKRVPPAFFERPKMGFGVPIGLWMRNAMRPLVEETLEESRLKAAGLFNPQAVRRLWEAHLSGSVNADSRLWIVMMAELWLRRRQRSFS